MISLMRAGEAGVARYEATRFKEACTMLQDLVKAEGGEESEQAKARCFVSDVKNKVADDFKTPFQNKISLQERQFSLCSS